MWLMEFTVCWRAAKGLNCIAMSEAVNSPIIRENTTLRVASAKTRTIIGGSRLSPFIEKYLPKFVAEHKCNTPLSVIL